MLIQTSTIVVMSLYLSMSPFPSCALTPEANDTSGFCFAYLASIPNPGDSLAQIRFSRGLSSRCVDGLARRFLIFLNIRGPSTKFTYLVDFLFDTRPLVTPDPPHTHYTSVC